MMRQRFHVVQIMPWSGTQTPFADVIASLVWGLQELGHEASSALNTWNAGARHIVLCPHLLTDATIASLPADTIYYNLEQIDPFSPLPPSRLAVFRNRNVWDYSDKNLLQWGSLGIAAAKVPVGWYPAMSRIGLHDEKQIDLLFYGVLNRRRIAALNDLARAGLTVHVASGVFSTQLDELLAQARAVLNIHCYPTGIFESVRASLPLANGIPVISERSESTEVPPAFESLVCWATYDQLADACKQLLADDARRRELAVMAKQEMCRHSIVPLLKQALEATALTPAADTVDIWPAKPRMPKIFHFVDMNDERRLADASIDSWRKHHPDASFRVWGRDALSDVPWFNARHMNMLADHDSAAAANLMRWEVLFREGGVSPDIGSTCLRPLPDWIFECEMFACWENEIATPGLISNSVVGAVAANPFLFRFIQDIGSAPSLVGHAAWETTGALALTHAHRRHGYSNLTILPSHFFVPRHHTGAAYTGNGPVFADQEWHVPPPPGHPPP